MKYAAVVLLCSFFLWASSPDKPSLVITNVSLLDSRSHVASRATVVIKGKTILAVAKVAVIDTGLEVRVINGGAQSIVPAPWPAGISISPADAWQQASAVAVGCQGSVERSKIIEKGQSADLVLLASRSQDDFCGATRVTGVVLHGKYFSRAELEWSPSRQEAQELTPPAGANTNLALKQPKPSSLTASAP